METPLWEEADIRKDEGEGATCTPYFPFASPQVDD